MSRTPQGSIYALIDPRDDKIRYIGKTTQPVLTRLAGHLANPTNPAMRAWIAALSLQGFIPRTEVVATASLAALDAEEQRQIRRHARQGHRLFNSPYYKEHLADLNRPATPTPQAAPRRPVEEKLEQEKLEERMARWFFGPMAQARAAGRVPAWWAFCFVVLCSPVYFAALFTRQLLGIRLVRGLLLSAVCALPFWEAGFDRAIQDLVLVHLPIQETTELWAAYGSGPLREFARQMMWPLLFACVIMGGGTYHDVAEEQGRRTVARRTAPRVS